VAETHGKGRGHLTTRQDLELHWVRLEEVPEIWAKLEKVGLTTRSACGHTLRNVACCPHSTVSADSLIDVQPLAKAVTDYYVERSDLINPAMPNRLNVYFGGCAACAPEAQINDIGFVPVSRAEGRVKRVGFEVWVGGSLGNHPILGYKIREFLPPEDVLAACQAIFRLHTQYGSRGKGKSRLKYLIERWGQEKFTEQFERLLQEKRVLPESGNFKLQVERLEGSRKGRPSRISRLLAKLGPFSTGELPAGALAQRQKNYLRLTVELPLGEIRAEQLRLLASVCRRHGNGEVYFTREQDAELHWVRRGKLKKVQRVLRERGGLSLKGDRKTPRVVACPGTEFCVLAVTNAQGAAKELLKDLGSANPAAQDLLSGLSVHISGCPNSCAKHQVGDIGLAGSMSAVGEERRFSYFLYLGGSTEGGIRLGEVVRKGITEEMVLPTLNALFSLVTEHRVNGESFRQVIQRVGGKKIAGHLEQRLVPYVPQPTSRVSMTLDGVPDRDSQEVSK